ncbi:MAG: RNA polymerase sigma factor [Pseudobacter sp.]|uniref:RNA polymerase sigma factor n=1 Tax=Pseudobacter sp. TaxID=2045420 RepID=UPI003F80E0B8
MQRIAEGDQDAFNQMVRRYTPTIYPFLLNWVKNAHRAEDLTQDVFIRLWDKREKLATVENFGGYLYVTTRNIANAALNMDIAGMEEIQADKLYHLLSSPSPPIEMKELAIILDKGIQQLPPRRKEVFLLSRMEGMTYDAIATQLTISRSAVRQHIVESLVFLRHYLKKHADVIVSLLLMVSLLLLH